MPAMGYVSICLPLSPGMEPASNKNYAPFRAFCALVRSHAGSRSDRASISIGFTAASTSLAGSYQFLPSDRVFIAVRGPQVHRDRAEALAPHCALCVQDAAQFAPEGFRGERLL